MTSEINGSSATIPGPLCDLDRLAHAMEARGLNGLVREERSLAEVRLRIDDQERTTIRVFGQPESEPVLGAYSLAGFGLQADADRQGHLPARLFLG